MLLLTIVSVAVISVSTARLSSPMIDPAFRSLFPKQTLGLACLLGTQLAATIGLGIILPAATWVGAGVIASLFGIRGIRRLIGRTRGEPPGDISFTSSIRDLAHRDAYTKRFDRFGPVTLTSQFGRPVVCIYGIDRGQRLLREHRSVLGPSSLAFSQQLMGGFLRYMDDATHDVYGPLFRRALSKDVTSSTKSLVEELTRKEFLTASYSSIEPQPRLRTIAEASLLGALFGIDPTSMFGKEFLGALRQFGSHAIHHSANRRAERDLDTVRRMVQRAIPDRGSSDRTSALSELQHLDPLQPDDTAVDNLLFMWKIGSANTSALQTWVIQHVAQHPDIRSRLGAGEIGLSEAVVSESLRLSQSEYIYRRLTRDVEFDGYTLRRGWRVRVCVAESHRDPANFEQPEHFTDRFLGSRPAQSVYSPFGFDRHACNAASLATSIAATTIDTITSDPGVILTASSRDVRDFRHWSHWRPGPDLRITRATQSGLSS